MSWLALAIYSGALIGFGFLFGFIYGNMYAEYSALKAKQKTRAERDTGGSDE